MGMDINTVKAFFMWCTIIDAGILLAASVMCIFFADFSYRMNHRFFAISREAFNVVIVAFIGLFKIFILVFNIAPWVALMIIS